jgi:P27 family predicted phage terminase small subunit
VKPVASPKPLSIEDKKLRGNPGKRALHEELVPKADHLFELPPPPEYLGEYGVKEWKRTGPALISMRMLAESDLPAFEAYCMNIELMIQSRLDIEVNGLTIVGQRGRIKNPAVVSFGQATTAIRGFVGEFGLSPSARSRIRVPTEDQDILTLLMGDDGDEENFNDGV